MSVDIDDERFCSNCRAELPAGAGTCPACGVFAGDMFDGRTAVQKRASRKRVWTIAVLLIAIAMLAGAWFILRDSPGLKRLIASRGPARTAAPPARVVSDRPGGERRIRGAVLTQSEAVRVLRGQLTSTGEKPLRNECLAILSEGMRDGSYLFSAVDSCERTRLGRWRVDGKTEEVQRDRRGTARPPA